MAGQNHESVFQVSELTVSRRAFVQWASTVGVGMAVAACSPAPPPPPPTAPPTESVERTAAPPTAIPTAALPKAPASPSAAPTIAPTAAPPKAPEKVSRAAVAGPNISFTWTALYLAKDKGFDKQSGIDLEIQHMTSDKVAMQALIANEVQIMEGNLSAFLTGRAGGAPLKVIGANLLGAAMALGIRADRGITRLSDLYGKAVGISQPGALPDTLIRALFQKEGLDPEKVTYVAAGGNTDRARALMAGKVDAAILHYSDVALALTDPSVKVLIRISDALPEYVSSGSGTSDTIAAKQPEIPLGYMKTMILGIRYLIANRSESVAFASKLLGAKPEELAPLYEQYLGMWAVNGHFPREAATYMQDLNIKSGTQDRPISIDEAVTWEFTDKAIAALGKANPPGR